MQKTFEMSKFLEELEYLVNFDSGSWCPEGTAKVADFFRNKFEKFGWQVQTINADPAVGPFLEITNGATEHYDILLVGHMDTVFPRGTAAERPFHIKDGRAYGAGVVDMKASLLFIYYAICQLQAEGKLTNASICIAMNSDEEITSRYSRPWIEKLAQKSSYALILEPARINGDMVNKRKGLGRYSIHLSGVAAHAGVNAQDGSSAINELAHWILNLHSMNNPELGTTINVGIVSGGTNPNVVADKAIAEVDLRYADINEVHKLEKFMVELVQNPKTPGVTAQVLGGIKRPPMNPSEKTLELCDAIDKIAAEIGVSFNWIATGGASDGNITASFGVPTVDGLGPVGGGAHGIGEYLQLDSVEPRLKLFCETIKHILKK